MSEPGGIEAGPLYVDVVANTSGFGRDLQAKINAETARVKADITAQIDSRKAEAQLASIERKQRQVALGVTVDDAKAQAQLAAVEAKKRVAEIRAEADVARAEAALAKVAAQDRVAKIRAEADVAAAEAKLDQAAAKKRTVVIKAEIEDASAEAALEKIAAKRRIAKIQAEADTLNAERRLDQATRNRTVRVDVDTSSLDKVGSKLTSLGSAGLGLMQFPAIASGISMAAGALAQVAAGLTAVVSAAAPAVGVLGAIPGLVAGAAQGIGTIITGFSGIGDAMKKSSAAEASAASASASASAQRVAAAERIASAQDRVKQAQASLANTEATAAHAVEQAQQSVARAHEESARTVQKATQRVADEQQQAAERIAAAQRSLAEAEQTSAREIEQAQQRVGEAHQQAAQNVAQAERQLISAQQDAVSAQRDLIQAREDAARQLEDLNARTQGGRLSVEGAQISVQRAEIHRTQVFSSTSSTNLDKQQADLDYREAVQRLHDQQREQGRLEEDTRKANRAGVEGSDLVTRAKQRLNDANQKIRDAEAAITKARRDGARQIAQAEQALTQARRQGAQRVQAAEVNLSKARQDSARQIRDAEDALTQARLDGAQKVAQAEDNLANTRRTSAFSVASAQHAVIEAQQALAQAHAQAGAAATKQGAADAALAAAMAKLSPAGRGFVTFLLNTWIPAWDKVKIAVQDALIPPVQRGLTALLPLMGILRTGMVQTAAILGGAFEDLARTYLATPIFKRDMATILGNNNRAFGTLTTALTPIVRALTDVTVASGPLLQRFADFIARSAILVSNFIHTQRETGGLTRFFKLAGDTAAQLGRVLWNLITAIFNIGKAARPSGQKLLDSFEGVTKKWADWTKSMGGQNKLKAYFDHALPIMYELGDLIHDIVVDFFDLGNNDSLAGLIRQIRTQALPAIKTLADNLSGAFGKSLVTAISDVAQTLADLTSGGGGGALTTFVDTLDAIVKDIDALIKMPGVGPVIGFLASLAGGIAAVSLVLGPAIKGLKLMSGALEAVAVRAGLAAEGFTVMGAAINFAMGPIGLVLAILAIIGLALYELYQHWAPFHNFIDGQVTSMKTALSNLGKMWTWLSKEVKRELGVLGDDVKRVFRAISDDWDRTKRDVGAMRDSIGRAVDKIKGFFTGLGKSISDWWNHTVKPTWANVRAWWDRTRDSIGHGKDRIVGFFTSLGNSIRDWWNMHVSPIWARVVSTWNTVRDKIGSAIGRIKGFFTSLGKSIQDVYASYIKVYFDAIKTALGRVQDAFRTGVGKIKGFWDGLKAAVANPVKFVIDTIYNSGIRGFWNMVASKVGLPQLDKLTVRGINAAEGGVVPGAPPGRPGQPFATGGMARAPRASGVLPGYAPGVDVVNAVLSPGEGILVPEAVRGLARVMGTGAENAIQTINSSFSSRVRPPLGARRSRADGLPGFDVGGVFGWVGNQIGRGASAAKNWVGDKIGAATDALKNAAAGALSGPLHAAAGPIHSLINSVLPASPFFSNMLRQGSNQVVDKAIDNIVGKDEAMNVPTGGGAGMGWQQLWSIVKGAFPNAQLLSSFRPGAVTRSGSTSYHALGQAIDVTPSMAIFNWLASHYRNSRELIFSPANGRQIWNGKPHMYTGPTRADHFNHVHWAGPAGGGGGGGGGGGPIPGGGGVARWAGMVKNALARLGLSTAPAMVARVLRQISTESGGNPNAVQGNIGDVNNRSGDLAKGLMQVIGATFRAYHVPGTSWSQFDPWASILAGLNYAKHRYGPSLSFLGQGHGYSLGGVVPGLSRMATGGVATASAHARHLAHLAHIRHLAHLRHIGRQVVGPRPRTVVPTHPKHPKPPPTPARPTPSIGSLLHTTGDTGRQLMDRVATIAGQVAAPIPAAVNSRLHSTGDTGAALLQQLLAQGGRLFDTGGILNPGATLAVNATRQNEYILTGPQWDSVSRLAASATTDRAIHEPTADERLRGAQIQIDVHPQPGTNARQVAQEVAVELGWMLR